MLCDKCKKTYDDSFLFCPYCGKKNAAALDLISKAPTRYQMIKAFTDEELIEFVQNIPKDSAEGIRTFLDEKMPRKVFVVGTRSVSWSRRVLSWRDVRINSHNTKDDHETARAILDEYLEKPIEYFLEHYCEDLNASVDARCFYIDEIPLSVGNVKNIGKTVFYDESSIPYDVEKMKERSDKIKELFDSTVAQEKQRFKLSYENYMDERRKHDPALL